MDKMMDKTMDFNNISPNDITITQKDCVINKCDNTKYIIIIILLLIGLGILIYLKSKDNNQSFQY
jgi:plastocyanin domain-containing protein